MISKPSQQADIAERKRRFIEYYEKVPVVKYAAQYCGRDQDTAHRWLKEDTDFAYQVQEAEARFIKEKMKNVKGEFALERLFKQVFAQRTELTGAEGTAIQLNNQPTPEETKQAVFNYLDNNPDALKEYHAYKAA